MGDWLGECHFRILTQRVTFETSDQENNDNKDNNNEDNDNKDNNNKKTTTKKTTTKTTTTKTTSRQRPKREFEFGTSGQFRTLAMFSSFYPFDFRINSLCLPSLHCLNIYLTQGPLYLNREVTRLLVDLRRRHRGQNWPGHNRRLLRADGRHPKVIGDGLYPFLPVTGLFSPVIVAFSPMWGQYTHLKQVGFLFGTEIQQKICP